MLRNFYKNFGQPRGLLGKWILRRMNHGHVPLAEWGLEVLAPAQDAHILDIGCGGGANIVALLELCPQGRVDGIDYSQVSVKLSRETNAGSIRAGRCEVTQGDAGNLPYAAGIFDIVTAFETVYFWGDLPKAFAGVHRILKAGGKFLIVCEVGNPEQSEWEERIEGFKIHSSAELKKMLLAAGFTSVETAAKGNSIRLIATNISPSPH